MFSKSVKYFTSDSSNSYEQEANNCLAQIKYYLEKNKLNTKNIFSISIFLRVENNEDFKERKSQIQKILINGFTDIPPITYIAQTPFQRLIAFELTIGIGDIKIINNTFDNINYKTVLYQNHSEIYSSEIINENKEDTTLKNSKYIFQKIKNLLKKEKMDFSNIVRQWNYIENILSINHSIQNYQALNDTRSEFFSKAKWINGYPAATGIGTNAGKIIINFLAIRNNEKTKIFPIHSPIQSDAHKYSENVLISNKKQTPKFERGKIVFYDCNIDFYISGTAAIEGENTIESIDVEKQTEKTFENIKSLISIKNLVNQLPKNYFIKIKDVIKLKDFSNFRIYVKNESDISKVKEISKNYIGKTPSIFLVADICRDNLLVEIEGNVFV